MKRNYYPPQADLETIRLDAGYAMTSGNTETEPWNEFTIEFE